MQTLKRQIGTVPLTNPIILAPMAGITSLPYRRIMKSYGAALVHTEMISANGLIREGKKTRELLESSSDEEPLAIQLFGDDPQILARAAEMVVGDGALLDINMGCPVKKVIRSGAGSALLKDPSRIARIIIAARRSYSKPLTIKIRSGWDQNTINFLEVGRIAQDAGVDAITLHPRTRAQGFSGQANWQHIGELKAALSIPVFGSGDIFEAADAQRMLNETGCDGVMIGRGAYGNPWLIREVLDHLEGKKSCRPTGIEIYQTAMQHLQMHLEQFGERKALFEMRKHLCWYAKGLNGSSQFRARLQKTDTCAELKKLTEDFFQEELG
ncbi:MAG TPA: tRNA dihydrouridine synthase DusB [Geopsychrobacteraceae bacterium]|nr:tRNA dihydrouridine synthase DusB [Geopsychrobacteraceae bacterium]